MIDASGQCRRETFKGRPTESDDNARETMQALGNFARAEAEKAQYQAYINALAANQPLESHDNGR